MKSLKVFTKLFVSISAKQKIKKKNHKKLKIIHSSLKEPKIDIF
jgi:hypothetical protein